MKQEDRRNKEVVRRADVKRALEWTAFCILITGSNLFNSIQIFNGPRTPLNVLLIMANSLIVGIVLGMTIHYWTEAFA